MDIELAVERVCFAYPQVFYACHTRHVRRRTGPSAVSQRDSEILVHLSPRAALTLGELRDHMGLAKSTLSEALTKLQTHGYVTKVAPERGRRTGGIVLTARGVATVRATSVLDGDRLRAALGRLTPRQRSAAVAGLGLLADACRGLAARRGR